MSDSLPPYPPDPAIAERRRSLRVGIVGQLQGQIVGLGTAIVVREVGFGGFSIQSPLPFSTGTTHVFRFTMKNGSSLLLRGGARHCRAVQTTDGRKAYNVGFEFLDADSPQTREDIDELLTAVTAAMVSFN